MSNCTLNVYNFNELDDLFQGISKYCKLLDTNFELDNSDEIGNMIAKLDCFTQDLARHYEIQFTSLTINLTLTDILNLFENRLFVLSVLKNFYRNA